MLMLFVEKWVSLSWYNPVFFWISPHEADDRQLDAYFALFGKKAFDENPEWFTNRVEYSGLFWHFVDLVWIFLFPILYLL